MPITGPFEQYASRYDDWFENNEHVYQSELEAIRNLLPHKGKFMEVGAGGGRFAAPLGVRTGIEPSRQMAMMARDRGIDIILGAGEALPLKDCCFDCVLMVTTICFLDDVPKALLETHRVLKRGGLLVIGLVDIESRLGSAYRDKKDNVFYREATFYSAKQVADYMESAGFDKPRFKQTIFDKISNVKSPQPARDGHGDGIFVAIAGTKT